MARALERGKKQKCPRNGTILANETRLGREFGGDARLVCERNRSKLGLAATRLMMVMKMIMLKEVGGWPVWCVHTSQAAWTNKLNRVAVCTVFQISLTKREE